jgi:hypothetical protein
LLTLISWSLKKDLPGTSKLKPRQRTEMPHFALNEWVDFARDVVDPDRKAAMERHLESGCSDCQNLITTFSKVNEFAHLDSAYEPPDAAIRYVKGMFGIHGPRKAEGMQPLLATLLFDSLLSPLRVGVRSAESSDRQLLFRAGSYEIDLSFSLGSESRQSLVMGQVVTSNPVEAAVDGIAVALMRSGKVVIESLTNSSGEFRLEHKLSDTFELRFRPYWGHPFYIPTVHAEKPFTGSLPSKVRTTRLRSSMESSSRKKRP